ncbi:MAG: NAD(+) diphosphatase [Thermoleophilaceae bacterium]
MGTNTFAGAVIDRAAARRTDADWIAARVADPASRAVAVTTDGVLVDGDRAARFPLAECAAAEPVFLGVEDGQALFAVEVDGARDGTRVVGVREAGAFLAQAEGGVVAYAAGLLNWHRRHPRCSVCGTATEIAEAGHIRRCPNCGAVHHPRTDPVVIMLVTDGDRALLGRQPHWPPGRYSALAGFVEPGESLEEAVAREVLEEAGVEVADIRYQSSQPWPFPTSLMLGFTATYAGGEAAVRDAELEDVRWFTTTELAEIDLPPPLAIARRLIDGWRQA